MEKDCVLNLGYAELDKTCQLERDIGIRASGGNRWCQS